MNIFFSNAYFQQFDSLLVDFATSTTYNLCVQLYSNSIAIHYTLAVILGTNIQPRT